MDRAAKAELITTLNAALKDAGTIVVAHNNGLVAAQSADFRKKGKAAGGTVKVAKNKLAALALKGTKAEGITKYLKGPTILAYSQDPVAAAKAVSDFAKTNDKLVILGGAMGATTLDADGVKALATMPSLDELRAKIVGMISTPATRIAAVVKAPAGNVARVIGAYARKEETA